MLGQQILLSTGPLQIGVTALAAVMAVALLGEILWQAVLDRRREIGLLRAVGWARIQVASLMMGQGVMLGVCWALLGVVVALAILVALLGSSGLVAAFAPAAGLALAGGALLGLIASGLPAYRAAREAPSDVLRSL